MKKLFVKYVSQNICCAADAAGAVYSTVPAESDESDYDAGRRSRADYAAPFEATKLEIRKNFPNAPLALTENV